MTKKVAVKTKKTTAKKVIFSLKEAKANTVSLAGDFNGWDANSVALKKMRGDTWKKDLQLESGKYEYKFIVDGQWIVDPDNNQIVTNSFGSENSVFEV